ncbi:MAG: HlyC/CorC family transporter [Opitutae bacterium]|nr:HlyC/CorC family transporter [Opitutae bacterium]
MNLLPELIVAVALTIGISALCSTLEAMILSITPAEIEALKKKSSRKGKILERYREEIEETTSSILSLNTIANTLGATLVGGLAEKAFGDGGNSLLIFAGGMTLGILFFAEIIPKNIAVAYRGGLQANLVYPLAVVRFVMAPISKVCKATVKAVVPQNNEREIDEEEEIILLARKGAKEGSLSNNESDLVTNALRLDDIHVRDIMTPRTVVTAFEEDMTVEKVFDMHPNVPFARVPIFAETIDSVTGIVRRRDLLQAAAEDKDEVVIKELAQEVVFVPENASADKALRLLLAQHSQLVVVADEFGSTVGVLAMEDIIESILGQEIFEHDDVAVDMRELARRKSNVIEQGEKVTGSLPEPSTKDA